MYAKFPKHSFDSKSVKTNKILFTENLRTTILLDILDKKCI